MPKKKTTSKPKTRKVGRDAGTGQFIPIEKAKKRKKTAVVETIPIKKKKK